MNPQELEIDQRTGMKNYIGAEGRGWDTSFDFVRKNLVRAIEMGRRAKQNDEVSLTLFLA